MKQYKVGVVIGKFMPPHVGHEYLFNFANMYCDELFILVDNISTQTIPTNVRINIIKEIMPFANVKTFPQFMPQDPSETELFWDIWKNNIENVVGKKIDVLVAAMDYGFKLSSELNCNFIPIDIERNSLPISATKIRENPYECWDYLPQSTKCLYNKKVCILGSESTGKSTTVKKLAKDFKTIFVPEYAESIISRQGQFYESNVEEFVLGQFNSESSLLKFANKILISDTSVVSTLVWAEICFNTYSKNLERYALNQKHDLVLVFDCENTKWVYDSHRDFLDNETEFSLSDIRKEYQEKLIDKLNYFKIPYHLITGNYDDKYIKAKELISNLI